MTRFVVTYDLTEGDDYGDADDVLEKLGFEKVTPNKGTPLPNTTALGGPGEPTTAAVLSETIRARFRKAGLRPTAVFVGQLNGWAMR